MQDRDKEGVPESGPEWRVATAGKFSGFWITTWKTRQKYSPFDLAGGKGDACMWFGLAHFLNGYSFLMISPNLLDIWPVFFLILSHCETLHFFFIVIRTSGDGYSLLGSKK
jgi:hypothetical protein